MADVALWLGAAVSVTVIAGFVGTIYRWTRSKVRVSVRKIFSLDAQGSNSWSAVVQVDNETAHPLTIEQVLLEVYVDEPNAKVLGLTGTDKVPAHDSATYEAQQFELRQVGLEWPTNAAVAGSVRLASGRVYSSRKRRIA